MAHSSFHSENHLVLNGVIVSVSLNNDVTVEFLRLIIAKQDLVIMEVITYYGNRKACKNFAFVGNKNEADEPHLNYWKIIRKSQGFLQSFKNVAGRGLLTQQISSNNFLEKTCRVNEFCVFSNCSQNIGCFDRLSCW